MRDVILSRLKSECNDLIGGILKVEKKYLKGEGYDFDDVEKIYYDVIEKEYYDIIDSNDDFKSVFLQMIYVTGNKHIDVIQKISDYCVEKKSSLAPIILGAFPEIKIKYDDIIQQNNFISLIINRGNTAEISRLIDDFPEKHEEIIVSLLDADLFEPIDYYVKSNCCDEDLFLRCFGIYRNVNVKNLSHFKNVMDVLIKNKIKMVWCGRCDVNDDRLRDLYLTGLFYINLHFSEIFNLFKGDLNSIVDYYENNELKYIQIEEKYVDRYDIWEWLDAKYNDIVFSVNQYSSVDLNKILSLANAYPSRVRFSDEIYDLYWCKNQNIDAAKQVFDTIIKNKSKVMLNDVNGTSNFFTGTHDEKFIKLIDFCNYIEASLYINFYDEEEYNKAKEMTKFQNRVKCVLNDEDEYNYPREMGDYDLNEY